MSQGGKTAADKRRSGKFAAAWLLLISPWFAYPLFWLKTFCSRVPYWDDAVMFGRPAMALVAAAVLLASGPSGIRRACGRSKTALAVVIVSAVLWLISLFRCFAVGEMPDPGEWFVFLLPLAGMVLSREILRILPLYGTALLALLAFFTCRSVYFTGLPGNWNWNLSLLAALLPAPFLCARRFRIRWIWAVLLLPLAAVAVFSLCYPELTPRGTIAGCVFALIAVWLLFKISCRQRMMLLCLAGGAGAAMFFTVWFGPADSAVRSSRVWLWRGSAELAISHCATGVGMAGFERHINPHLPKDYYFSDFATERHPHPHNEFLALWSGYGVAGAVFLVLLYAGSVRGFRVTSGIRIWAFWMFLLLLIHGQFDVLLDIPLAGTLFWCLGGVLLAVPVRDGVFRYVAGICGLAVALFWAGTSFYAGYLARGSRFDTLAGNRVSALDKLERSLAILPEPQTRYRAGMVAFFDLKDPDGAIRHFGKLGPGYVHSNGFLARAYAVRGEVEKALEYFDRETRYYPMSALNAFWEFEMMKLADFSDSELSRRRARLDYLLKIRGLSAERIGELIGNPALDDAPIKNP